MTSRRAILGLLGGASVIGVGRHAAGANDLHPALPGAAACLPVADLIAHCPAWPDVHPFKSVTSPPRFTHAQWQEYMRAAFVLQRQPREVVEQILIVYEALASRAISDFPFHNPTILLRVMYEVPQQESAGRVRPSDGQCCRILNGHDAVVSDPVSWSASGPELTAFLTLGGTGGGRPLAYSTVFREFAASFELRRLDAFIDRSAPVEQTR